MKMPLSLVDYCVERYSRKFYKLEKTDIRDVVINTLLSLKKTEEGPCYCIRAVYYALCSYTYKLDKERCAITGETPYHHKKVKEWQQKNRERYREMCRKSYYKDIEKTRAKNREAQRRCRARKKLKFDEVLQDNKKLADLIKWGKR